MTIGCDDDVMLFVHSAENAYEEARLTDEEEVLCLAKAVFTIEIIQNFILPHEVKMFDEMKSNLKK